MKILHFSDQPLPDPRIERYSYLLKKEKDWQTFFVGGEHKASVFENTFDKIFSIKSTRAGNLLLPYFYQKYKKEFKKVVKEINPDIVHAHNFIPAKVCLDLKLPFVYDDHEFWSFRALDRKRDKDSILSKRYVTNRIFSHNVAKWEEKIIKTAHKTITVSDPIGNHHSEINPNVVIIPNFPTSFENRYLEELKQSKTELEVVLVSLYKSQSHIYSTDKFIEIIQANKVKLNVIGPVQKKFDHVNYLGYLSHIDYIKHLSTSHIGLAPISRNKISAFYFLAPNRFFQYPHSGVMPVIHQNMDYAKSQLGENCLIIDKEEDIEKYLQELRQNQDFLENNPKRLKKFANENLLLDNFQNRIVNLYN